MFNLRFKCTVISSWYMVLHAVPKANKMNYSRTGETVRCSVGKEAGRKTYEPSGLWSY